MTKDLFSKKIITLRKKHHLTQQELADKLNISNKTVSRWETAESYPDIELLPEIAAIFHVSIDYLLTDRENIHDIGKLDIVNYIPFIIGFVGIILYYLLQNIDMPIIFCFFVYYLITKFSYRFYHQYTSCQNGHTLIKLNTVTTFFATQSIIFKIFLVLMVANQMGSSFAMISGITSGMSFSLQNDVALENTLMAQFFLVYITSIILAGICAYLHYQKYLKDIVA